MKTSTLFSFAAGAAAFLGSALAGEPSRVRDTAPTQSPSTAPVPGQPTSQGCFSSGGNFTTVQVEYMSSGSCTKACSGKGYYVAGLHGAECDCGFVYPPKDDLVSDSKCTYPCPTYPEESCGGIEGDSYWSVFNLGDEIVVGNYKDDSDKDDSDSKTKSSSSSTQAHTSTTTSAAETSAASSSSAPATETSSSSSDDDNTDDDKDSSGGGSDTGAIVGGVVAGVVVIAAAVGLIFFFMRRKRNAEIEEEHRRNAAVNAFISGAKPPGSSGSISMTDSRLDPVLAHRRLSDGSIADNQDYSRKILRVTNA